MKHTPAREFIGDALETAHLAGVRRLKRRRERATIDFETRSAANIRNGAWLYSKHKSTRILCLSFLLPGQDPLTPSLWAPAMGGYPAVEEYPLDEQGRPYDLERLFQWIEDGGLVEAHNVNFEAMIWRHIAVKPMGEDRNGATGMGAPEVKDSQWRCSAAKAAACALPRDLEGAGEALNLPDHLRKEEGPGRKAMLKLSKPRRPRKGEAKELFGEPIIYYPDYDREEFEFLYAYNKQDVTAEHAISEETPDLSEREYQVWLADFRANRRGVLIDVELVDAAIRLEAELKQRMNETLQGITATDDNPDGIKGTQRAQILDWLAARGIDLPDSTAPTLDHLMESDLFAQLPEHVQTVVRIARNINRTSVSKFKRIRECMDPDDHRVRELVMYHGAATGRWSGKGIQVQNFPRGVLDDLVNCKAGTVSMAQAVEDVKTRDLQWCLALYGDVLSLLSSVLRGCLVPSPGKVFYVADYAAIEARVVLWLAGAVKALEVFRRGEDIYCDMASGIYRRPINKKDHPKERGFGKVAVLGLGYGMGYLTFLLTLRSYKIKFSNKDAMDILGEDAEKYVEWVRKQLWPEPPEPTGDDDKDAEAIRKYKNAKRAAAQNLRRLTDEREDPTKIVAELALCKFTVDAYRRRYPEVPKLWKGQEAAATHAVYIWKKEKMRLEEDWEKERERAKKRAAAGKTYVAVQCPEPEPQPVECGKVTWVVEGRWLKCYLPSGRCLYYAEPDVKGVKTPWGEKRLSLRFMGVHKKSRKWARMSSYGGSLVENIDQATARDMMADALIRIDQSEFSAFYYELIASIHDEALSEADDEGEEMRDVRVKEFEGLMESLDECYAGCPVKAEGARLLRYQK